MADTTTTTAQQASTPAPTTAKAPTTTPATASTPVPTNKAAANCIKVSVEGDATYCVTGPICSGSGKAPAGVNCPKKGDVAVESCLKTLKSYVDASKCVAPVNAECRAVKTGVWGCAWPTTTTVSATPASTTKAPTATPTATLRVDAGSGGRSGSQDHASRTPVETAVQKVSFRADGANASEREGSADSGGGVAVGAAAAVAAAACAAVGAALYRKKAAARELDTALGTPLP